MAAGPVTTVGFGPAGSHDVSVENVWVPDNHVVTSIAAAKGSSPNLRFPRGPRLAYNKAGVALGIARAAIDTFTDLALGKQPRFSSTRPANGHGAELTRTT